MNICDKSLCTSCGMCVDICTKGAIKLVTNKYGFDYPEVDNDLCINCGLCQKKCHINNDVKKNIPQKAFAVWCSDANDRKTSTSGGAASIFYQKVIADNGVCFGAAYDENLNVVIKGYDDQNVLEFKNSKYVHSNMKNAYKEIFKFLKSGRKVIFIGLPCQIASVKSYLGKDCDNLLLVDIICHGTPPQKYLSEHISYLENKKKKKANGLKFRSDNEFYFALISADGSCFANFHKDIDSYLLTFFEALTYYDSCYNCKYACNERVSDITIGDFWGLGEEEPFNHPYSGAISVVLTNTEKGKDFFESVKDKCFYEERTVKEAFSGNAQLNSPSNLNKNRDVFMSEYIKSGFETAAQKTYGEYIKEHKLIIRKYEMNKKIRRFAKRILRR